MTPPAWPVITSPGLGKLPIIGVPEDVVAIPLARALLMAPKMVPKMLLSGATTAMR